MKVRALFIISIPLLILLAAACAQAQPPSTVETNQARVQPGVTNSAADAKKSARVYKERWEAALNILHTPHPDYDAFEKAARALIDDFPTRLNGYCDIMILAEHYEKTRPDKSRQLAAELAAGTAPEQIKLWAKGYLYRLDSMGKPVPLKFTAVDGREVDLTKMKGKVVLVDFWATTCSPCVADLPKVKAAYDKFHASGFEVIGISCDTDKSDLEKFIKRKELAWPEYFDGNNQLKNKLAQQFGIDGIPHMFLIDKNGNLRADNVHARGDFEDQISKLLEEKSGP